MNQSKVRRAPVASLDRRYQTLRLPATEAQRAHLLASLERHGQRQPLLVTDHEPERLLLLDGFKRLELLERQGHKELLVTVETLDEERALLALLTSNATRRGPSALEEAWVVDALHRRRGLTQPAIAALLSRDKSWVCRRLKLVSGLERQVQEDVKLGLLAPATARELARLPPGNQTEASACVIGHRLTSRQTRRLVELLLGKPPEQRAELLRDPLSHLQTAAPSPSMPKPDPRLSAKASELRLGLLRLHSASHRLDELLCECPPARLSASEASLLGQLAGPITTGLRGLLRQLDELRRERSDAA